MGKSTFSGPVNSTAGFEVGGVAAAVVAVADLPASDASEAHALNATFSDTEVEAALNALGAKLNALIDALAGA